MKITYFLAVALIFSPWFIIAVRSAPTAEEQVMSEPWMQGLNADQRAAWFAHRRAVQAEADRDELLNQNRALLFEMQKLRNRKQCV